MRGPTATRRPHGSHHQRHRPHSPCPGTCYARYSRGAVQSAIPTFRMRKLKLRDVEKLKRGRPGNEGQRWLGPRGWLIPEPELPPGRGPCIAGSRRWQAGWTARRGWESPQPPAGSAGRSQGWFGHLQCLWVWEPGGVAIPSPRAGASVFAGGAGGWMKGAL